MRPNQVLSTVYTHWKRFLPKSLFGRFLMIIITPTILLQLFATYQFYARHWDSMSRNMTAAVGGEIAAIVRIYEESPPNQVEKLFTMTDHYMGLEIRILPKSDVIVNEDYSSGVLGQLATTMKSHFFYPFSLQYTKWLYSDVRVVIGLPNDNMEIIIASKRLENPSTYIFIMWMIGTAIVLLLIAILFLKNQIRAIQRLAIAADKFGKGEELKNFRPHGASEVRKAGAALIQMKDRIARQVAQRTEMLAGISHDLRTPLTRMKLQLALLEKKNLPEEAMQRLHNDIHEMETMVESYLLFAKGEGSEKPITVQWSAMIEKWVQGYDLHGRKIQVVLNDEGYITLRYDAFKRAFTNIVNNALRHGESVRITSHYAGTSATVTIEDNGAGIPADKREEAFRPFVRLDAARNRDEGGNGLGLTIARDIVLGHGGDITLGDSDLGGLKVEIRLPV
jgi:two-component system osmolarity sensor histidine kinase EnvZ